MTTCNRLVESILAGATTNLPAPVSMRLSYDGLYALAKVLSH